MQSYKRTYGGRQIFAGSGEFRAGLGDIPPSTPLKKQHRYFGVVLPTLTLDNNHNQQQPTTASMGKKGDISWMEWDEYDVGRGLKQRDLGKYATIFVDNEITGRQLLDCLEEKKLAGN